MIKRRVGIAVTVAALLPLTVAFARGGWWVHTVENMPEYLVAGEPVEIPISLRGHGMTLMPYAGMVVHLTGPNAETRTMNVTPSAQTGYHTANLLVSEPGDWDIALQSGYMRLDLPPLRAIAAGSTPPAPLSVEERGRQLYVAKGCVTCHGSSATPVAGAVPGGKWTTRVGSAPELIRRPFPSREYVERVIANPGQRWMPNLNLSAEEIAAIAAFLHPET